MIQDEDLNLLLSELSHRYGYDFTNYARASLKRRVNRLLAVDRFASFAELLYKVKNDPDYLPHVVEQLTVNVTEMFRDPSLFRTLREQVLPVLATHPLIRVWHAGCSTGEEVYSLAIMLEEANLLHKSLLYATDINPTVIENIRRGMFPIGNIRQYTENYLQSGGRKDFSSYYQAQYEWAKFDERLRANTIVATHNLVSDRSFNEFQLILCRNVLIYFDKELQDKALTLFDNSLEKLGFLVLGSKENLRFSPIAASYTQLENKEKVWRKMR
ncbi:CheR family methyltransferase [Persicitalea jodogahamensis]|uniref:Chemotaxis protein CheR n=1 Tax=Persicitalea jodogahamensis TaxID=402147 RepID=A0A8J3DDI3_9BACT|nr:protein-glutamate O-methyltransferase CheR [Persicitalea jodogahamensis]GHB87101.1 chemotaxis protein CheR [Persicitalea jodogahamensis]